MLAWVRPTPYGPNIWLDLCPDLWHRTHLGRGGGLALGVLGFLRDGKQIFTYKPLFGMVAGYVNF